MCRWCASTDLRTQRSRHLTSILPNLDSQCSFPPGTFALFCSAILIHPPCFIFNQHPSGPSFFELLLTLIGTFKNNMLESFIYLYQGDIYTKDSNNGSAQFSRKEPEFWVSKFEYGMLSLFKYFYYMPRTVVIFLGDFSTLSCSVSEDNY